MTRTPAVLTALALCAVLHAAAQEDAGPPPEPGYTLHVYANRLQTATLVLNASGENLRNISAENVTISLDGGPRFHPTLVRPEGNDPLQLAVVFDVSGYDQTMQESVAANLPRLAGPTLTAADHLSLYALDCKLVGTVNNLPTSQDSISRGLDNLFKHPSLRDAKGHRCAGTLRLWDQLAIAGSRLGDAPGRRVLLLVSQGLDNGSYMSLEKLALFLGQRGISFFCLRDSMLPTSPITARGLPNTSSLGRTTTDAIAYLASTDGGLVFTVPTRDAAITLGRFVHLLRTRYIIEFPAPDESPGGFHGIDVRVPKAAYVLPSGVGWTQVDPSLKTDPNTIQAAPSPAIMGSQRPTEPH